MKSINNSLLLVVFSLLPLFFSSCSDDELAPIPTVSIEAGEVTDASLTFTVTAANATKYAYKCIKNGEAAPTIAAILTDGTKITDITKPIEIKDLLPNTKYVVYVAVEGKAGQVLSTPLTVTTKQKVMNIEFTEGSQKAVKGNNFFLRFANDTYELKVDFYTTTGAKYLMPGTYKLAGTKEMECDIKYTDLTTLADGAKKLFTEGSIEAAIVEGDTYEVKVSLTLVSGELVVAHYKGEILGMPVVEKSNEYIFTAHAAKRISVNNMIPGEYYIKLNDNNWDFEMALDFFADAATTELPVGTYTLNDSKAANTLHTSSNINVYKEDRDFTTHFDGTGTIEVTKTGKIYTFKINLTNSKGQKYTGGFTGEIKNMDLAN